MLHNGNATNHKVRGCTTTTSSTRPPTPHVELSYCTFTSVATFAQAKTRLVGWRVVPMARSHGKCIFGDGAEASGSGDNCEGATAASMKRSNDVGGAAAKPRKRRRAPPAHSQNFQECKSGEDSPRKRVEEEEAAVDKRAQEAQGEAAQAARADRGEGRGGGEGA